MPTTGKISGSKRPTILFIGGSLPPPYGGLATFFDIILPGLIQKEFIIHFQLRPGTQFNEKYEYYTAQGIKIHTVPLPTLKDFPVFLARLAKSLILNPRLLKRLVDAATIDQLMREKQPAWRYRVLSMLIDWHAIALLIATEQLVRKYHIDIIHAHDAPWYFGCVAAIIRQAHPSIKYIHSINGEVVPRADELHQYGSYNEKLKGLINKFLSGADLLLSISRASAQLVEYVGLSVESIKVIPHTIDTDLFTPMVDCRSVVEHYNLSGNRVVLFVGQIRPRKGPQILLEAIPAILADCPHTKFLFVGSGQQYIQELERDVAQLGVADHVHFVAGIPPREIAPYYAACDIFVFPSAMEGLGLAQVEAMLCAKPVVASNVGGIPEVLVDEETGLLVEPLSHRPLAQKVIHLLKNPALAQEMGQKGRQRALDLFEKNKILDEYTTVHMKVWQHNL